MDRQTHLRPLIWLGLALGLMALDMGAAMAADAGILDRIGQSYQQATAGWGAVLSDIARRLFLALALIEMLWSGIWWVIKRDDPNQLIVQLLQKVMGLMFFWAILLNFDTWIPAVIDGFAHAGQQASNLTALTPSTVLDRGLEIAAKITKTTEDMGLTDIGRNFLAHLSALGILLAFGVIAGQMLVALIESYMCVSAGVLFLGFAGSRWTTSFSEKYISYCVSVGVKLFVTYLVVGVGQNLSNGWVGMFTGSMVAADYLAVLAAAVVYMFVAWQIPSMASSMLTGSVNMTLGAAAATGATMAAGAMGAAATTLAAGKGAANSVAGAVQAGTSAFQQAAASGATGPLGMLAGAGKALAQGVAGAAVDGIKGLGGESTGGRLSDRIDATTAKMAESKAATPPPPPSGGGSGGGSGPSAPAAPSGGADGGSSSPAPASSGGDDAATRPTPAAPAATGAGSEAAPASSAPAGEGAQPAAPSGSATEGATGGTAGTGGESAQPAAPAAPSSSAAPAGSSSGSGSSSQPSAPKPGVLDRMAEKTSALGDVPNDSAGAAGVQINLKHSD